MAVNPTLESVIDAFVTRMKTVVDVGQVHDFRRNVKTKDAFLAAFEFTLGGQDMIRGWQLEPPRTVTLPKTQNLCFFKRSVFQFTGYWGWQDSSNTDKDVGIFVEDEIVPIFLADLSLGAAITDIAEIRTRQDAPIFFSKWLVHRPVIEFETEWQVQLS